MPKRLHLASLVDDWRKLGSETAVVLHAGNRAYRTSYAQLALLAGCFASELQRRAIGSGDRVLLWGENGPQWIGAYFGCLLRGVLAVPLDAGGSIDFAERVIADVTPKLLVGSRNLVEGLGEDVAQLAFESFPSSLPAEPQFTVAPEVTEDSPFQIIFTSGTTSEPRGIVHTHRNVLASLGTIESEIRRHRRFERPFHPLRLLQTTPLSHVFGQFMGLWIPPLLGAELHLTMAVDPGRMIAISRRERISVLVAVPRVLELLRTHVLARFPGLAEELAASKGLPAWRRWWQFRRVHAALGFKFWALICGGATLPPDLEQFWNGLGLALIQGYGMTETAALVTLNHPFRVGKGTLGKALPGREVRLGPEGEILVRGDMLAAGTWQHGRFLARSGEWLATGDLASQDATGELRFLGRKGDVIVTAAGMNIHPRDLEAALLAQSGVHACAVVACDGPLGPEPVAVVLCDRSVSSPAALALAANAQLAEFQQIRHILLWPDPAFPYTPTGKLLRRSIAAWACAQMRAVPGARQQLRDVDVLLTLISEITHESHLASDDTRRLTEDLHLDSLGRVQLQSALEARFGVEVSDRQMEAVQTLEQLRQVVQPQQGDLTSPVADGGELRADESFKPPHMTAANVHLARWPWSWPVQVLRISFLEGIVIPLVNLLASPRVHSDPPLREQGPFLIIVNHIGTYDLPLALRGLPRWLRQHTAVAMSAEVLESLRTGRGFGGGRWSGFFGRLAYPLLLALFNVFPLPRSSGFRQSFAHAGEALDRGYSVVVFPEGRRGWTGEMQPFRPGVGLLVQASRVPVLPIALGGLGRREGRKQRWLRSGDIRISVGQPLRFPADLPVEEITRQLEAAVRVLGPS